jgi:hypothetical protein
MSICENTKNYSKGKRIWGWTNLRHDEVDSHFVPRRRKSQRLEDSGRKSFLLLDFLTSSLRSPTGR